MTEEAEMIVSPGGAMELPPELMEEINALAQTGEELGSSMLDMLAIYSNDKGRWKTGDTKKDEIVGIFLHSFTALRSFWPPDAPMGDTPPSCWSLGGADAEPHPESIEPQHETCEGCPWDQFKTAKQGSGKACKTKRADFIIEVDPAKLEYEGNTAVLTPAAVLGLALVRGSATAKVTRRSIGTWAKSLQSEVRGIPMLALTKWTLVDEPGPAGDYSAPVLTYVGAYKADRESLQEVLDYAKALREGEAEQMLVALAGRSANEVDETED